MDSRFPGAIVWGDSLTTIYNDAFLPILGAKPEALGRSFSDVWAEAWPQIGPFVEKAFRGESTFIENYPLVVERFGKAEQAYFTFCYSPLRMTDGTIGGMMDTVVETTESVNNYAQRKLLNDELSHRLKNTISMVQAISHQTLKNITREEVTAFNKRLMSLASAHEVLTQQSWTKASMRQIIQSTLAAISDLARIDFEGCDIEVGPKAVLALSLVLHELATNAAKYGSLSNATGRVSVRCTVSDDSVALTWEERGGPKVNTPTRKGFGSRIIAMGLGGTAEADFKPEGLVVCLKTKLSELQHV